MYTLHSRILGIRRRLKCSPTPLRGKKSIQHFPENGWATRDRRKIAQIVKNPHETPEKQ